MLIAVPAATVIAIGELADCVAINTLAERDSGRVSVGLKATLVVWARKR
jgi:hypothetical protein